MILNWKMFVFFSVSDVILVEQGWFFCRIQQCGWLYQSVLSVL